jgi:pyruvate formate-lyase/glycerol dehydratase family glycyl radical enzyme
MVTTELPNLEQIEEVNKLICLTDRVKKRKDELMVATPHVAAERSRLLTESWKETEGDVMCIRKAKGFKKLMEGIPIVIHDDELIVGSQSKYIRGASPAVEWTPDYTFELFEGEKPTLAGLVVEAEVSEGEKASLLEDAEYWADRTLMKAELKARRELFEKQIDDLEESRVLIATNTRPTSSFVADFGKVLDKGLNGIIADIQEELKKVSFLGKDDLDKYFFLQSMIITCEGVISFAHRYAELAKNLAETEEDTVRKKELEEIAEICRWVPANPARSFHEALQSFWLTFLSINLEHAFDADTPGRIDQYLYPFYTRDIEAGRLTRQEAAELLGCLWVKFAEMDGVKGRIWKVAGEMNQGQDITIGGVTSDGSDATNELTYLLLEVTRQLKTVQPPLYLRCHEGTPEQLWIKAAEVNRDRGDGNPAFLNDQAVLLNFTRRGVPIEAARDWAAGGCVHPHVSHASTGDLGSSINLAKIFEVVLNNGVDPATGKRLGPETGKMQDFSSVEEVFDAFKKQFDFFLDIFTKYHHFFWQLRNKYYSLPFHSALMDDCISKGLDYIMGGCRYPQLYFGLYDRGHQNVADSLAVIKKLVFEEKKISMADLMDALASNFEGKEELRQMLIAAPKYGNDDDYVDEIFNEVSLWVQRRIAEKKHPLGVNFRVFRGGATQHFFFGQTVGALPDGRKAWEPLADGTHSPMRSMDVKGPTAVINSASKVNHTEVSTSSLFNMKFSRSFLRNRENLEKLIALIKIYFKRGGYHIQFNLMGQEILLEAKKHPEQYRDLLVRVAGYSAYFVDLSPEVQDDIIARAEHTL